jgi:hypothetical protein
MTYLSLANGRDADEGNRNNIRNPPIQSELEQGYLKEMMIILYEMLRILGLQVMDSNLGHARIESAKEPTQTEVGKSNYKDGQY